MSIKLRVLCVISALCFLGSIACFSGFAAELMNNPSFDEEAPTTVDPGYVDPGTTVDPGYVDPGTTVDPGYVDPGTTVDPGYVDPGTTSYDPGYVDPGTTSTYEPVYSDPNGGYDPTTTYSVTVSDVISEGNYPQPDYSTYTPESSTYYVDYSSEYNQYIANTYQAVYDDNYYYVPSYTAPEQSLIDISSKEVDTDELTQSDWAKIMLDLSDGSVPEDGTQTFNFIKDNEEEGDTSVAWMLYLGVVLILFAILTIIFVIITTNKANDKLNYA